MPNGVRFNQQSVKNRFPWKLALPLYALSNGITIFFLKAYYWEDWLWYYTKSNDELKQLFRSGGNTPVRGFFELDVLGARPELFKIITIICFFFSGWFLFHILGTVRILSIEQVRLITILFLILPLNSARVAMILFLYSYSFFLFYLAWYLLVTKRSKFARSLSIPLFLLSFDTIALNGFFVVPCMHFLYLRLLGPVSNKRNAYLSSVLLVSLAPLYWTLDRRFNAIHGELSQIHTPQKLGLIGGFLVLGICAAMIIGFLKTQKRDLLDRERYAIVIAGITIVALGAFPYITGGYLVFISDWLIAFVPRSSDWDSRHQLLLGLGLAIVITGVVGAINSRFKRQCLVALFGFCVMLNMIFMYSYYLDALKQDQVVVAFQSSSELKNSRVIIINDLADRYNARGRLYRSFEWDGILSKAFGDNSRSAIPGTPYIDCSDPLIPDTLLTITARNNRLESTLTRDLGIVISVEFIQPCN